jgi:hypothetical protein
VSLSNVAMGSNAQALLDGSFLTLDALPPAEENSLRMHSASATHSTNAPLRIAR